MNKLSPPSGLRPPGTGTLFGLVVGVLIGVLVAALVMPDHERLRVVGNGPVASGDGADTEVAAPIEPGAPPADAGQATGAATTAATAARAATGARPAGTGATSSVAQAGGATAASIGDRFPVVAERGVSGDTVDVGIAMIDTSMLGPLFDQGNPEEHYKARLRAWEKDGIVPLHGRKVRFVFRKYSALDQADQRAACKDLVEDKRVFIVIGTVSFRVGGECVSKEHQLPFVTSDATNETALARGAPYTFSIAMSDDRVMRNLPHWAHQRKLLTGPIGVYWNNADPVEVGLVETFKNELKKVGYDVAAEATTNTDDPSQNDIVAVRRFQDAKVAVAFIFAARDGFANAAESQGYRPKYLDSDHTYGTTDSNTGTILPSQWEGTLAMTGRRGGEFQAGIPKSAEQQKCLEDYKAHTGETLADDSFKQQMVLHSCDAANTVLLALQRVGRNLTRPSFVAGMESIRDLRLARSGHSSFLPNKHHGVDFYRTLQWQSSCRCFKVVGEREFQPLFVP